MALTAIDQIIRELCIETGEPDFKNYDKILSHVRRAMAELAIYVFPQSKTVKVSINNKNAIQWELDCIKPIRVLIKRKDSICTLSNDDGDYCSCSGSDKGTVKHDKENRLSYISYKFDKGDEVLFEYIADGIFDGVEFIPVEYEPAVREYVFWQYYRRYDRTLSDRAKQNYREEFVRLRKLYSSLTKEEWIFILNK